MADIGVVLGAIFGSLLGIVILVLACRWYMNRRVEEKATYSLFMYASCAIIAPYCAPELNGLLRAACVVLTVMMWVCCGTGTIAC